MTKTSRTEYLVARRNRSGGPRYYWRASNALRGQLDGSAFRPLVRLPDNRDEAEAKCRDITLQVRAYLADRAPAQKPEWLGAEMKRVHAGVRLAQSVLMQWGKGKSVLSTGVYAVASESGRIKIGFADRPLKRLERLAVGSPDRLSLLFFIRLPVGIARLVERRAHVLLSDYHSHGEWFEAPPALAISAILQAVSDH